MASPAGGRESGSERRSFEERRRGTRAQTNAVDQGLSIATVVRVVKRRRRPFFVTLAVVVAWQTLQAIRKAYYEPMFEGGFTLLISDPVNDRPVPNQGGGQAALDTLARNTFYTDVPTLIQVLQSSSVLDPVNEQLRKEGATPDALPKITVRQTPADPTTKGGAMTQVLVVSANSPDQRVLDRGLRLVEKAYLEWATKQRQQRLEQGLEYLDQQAPELERKSAELQRKLEEFRARNKVVQPIEETGSLRKQMEGLQQLLTAQTGERRRFEELLNEVRRGNLLARNFQTASERPDSTSRLEVNLPDQAVLNELERIDKQIEEARSTYRSEASLLKDLLKARERLKPEVSRRQMAAVKAALRTNANATAATRAQIQRLDQQFQAQPALLRTYDNLRQKLDIAEANRANFLKAREQFQWEIAQRSSPWQVISPSASAPSGMDQSLSKGVIQGVLLGVIAGAAVALLRDRLDHVFHEPREVLETLHVPLLGHMPYVAFFDGVRREKRFLLKELDEQNDPSTGYQRFYYQESLRNLYTSLRFVNPDRSRRSVAITSSVPCEGKSLLNVLLAKTISEMGQRVLLVDADLRKPQIHYRLGLENKQGLSDLLTNAELDWRTVVQPVPNYEGWSVITAGQSPSDPPRLLGSNRMADLVAELGRSQSFDLILYDTPQALGLADAPLVANHLEGIVLLVSLNRVDRAIPGAAVERIRDAGVPLLGLVTNAMRPSQGSGVPEIERFDPAEADAYGEEAWNAYDDESASLRRRYLRKAGQMGRQFTRWLDG